MSHKFVWSHLLGGALLIGTAGCGGESARPAAESGTALLEDAAEWSKSRSREDFPERISLGAAARLLPEKEKPQSFTAAEDRSTTATDEAIHQTAAEEHASEPIPIGQRQDLFELVDRLATRDAGTLKQVIHRLGRIGTDARAAAPAIERKLEHPNLAVRIHAALALYRIEGNTASVPVLLKALRSSTPSDRAFAIAVLGEMGPDAPECVSALGFSLADEDPYVRMHAAAALIRCEGRSERAARVLAESLRHPDPDVRWFAAYSLAESAADGPDTVEALSAALRDRDQRVRTGAVFALGSIGPSAAPALPDLVQAREWADPDFQQQIERTIHLIRAVDVNDR